MLRGKFFIFSYLSGSLNNSWHLVPSLVLEGAKKGYEGRFFFFFPFISIRLKNVLSSSEQGAKKSLLFYYLYRQMVGGGCVLSQWVPFRVRSRALGLLSWFIVPGVYFQHCSVVLHEANRSSVVFTFVLVLITQLCQTPHTLVVGLVYRICHSPASSIVSQTATWMASSFFLVLPDISDHAVLISGGESNLLTSFIQLWFGVFSVLV